MLQPQPKKDISIGYMLSMASQLGVLIAFPLVVCILIGVVIDRKMNTFPWFLLLMILVGIGLTVIDVYKVIIPFLEKRSGNNKK